MTVLVLGGINQDVVVSVADLPRRGETITALGVTHGAGGKGLNQAIAAARHGGAVRMAGAVGDDQAGAELCALMAREGIDKTDVKVLPGAATGQAFISLSQAGDNTIIVNAGANASYGAAEMGEADAGARVFLTQFEATLSAIETLFTTPQAEQGIRILNAAPAIDGGRRLLPLADVIVLNETELQVFAELADVPEEDEAIVAAARRLISRRGQYVVVTLGAKGCICVAGDSESAIPGFAMQAVDTIGAGDCFCGVLAASLDAGADIAQALVRANAAAALSVTRSGAGESAPSAADVDDLLARGSR